MKWTLAAAAALASSLSSFACTPNEVSELWDGAGGSAPEPVEPGAVTRLEAVWEHARSEGVSAVALVRHQGQVLGRFAAGQSRRDDAALPNTLETLFDVGSITKQFTGAAIMQRVERGELALDATLGELFEGVPSEKRSITVHQLLTHTAGFPSALGEDDEPILRDDYVARAWDVPLSAEPGSLHWYSNTGYSILGAIIERSTGQPYDVYLREQLLFPVGVRETGYSGLDVDPARVALGYAEGEVDDPLQRPHAPDGYYWNLRANGGTLSTAGDLLRWTDALLAGEVLGPEALERYLTPQVPEGLGSDLSYAYGWTIGDTPVGRRLAHDGGNGFFYAHVQRYLDADLLVIVLANEDSDAALRLPADLAHAVLPELPSPDEPREELEPALDRQEELDEATTSFVESIEFTTDEERAVAGFFMDLESGSARFRVRAPDGSVFSEGATRDGEPLERLLVIPPRLGLWQLEVETQAATGFLDMAWVWD